MSAVAGRRAFDVCGPLPTGTTVLEASAGTGKTYTIAALAARYVAEGVPLEQLLLITFTRMATGELRERVRARLVAAEQGLRDALGGALPADADDVLKLLAAGPPGEVARRQAHLATALAGFDGATIATTHGFCQEVLGGLGVAGDVEARLELLEDPRDLVEQVVDDLYVRRFVRDEHRPIDRAEALQLARAAVGDPVAPLAEAARDGVAAMRVRFAAAVRREFDARKRRLGVVTYDDLLTRLRDVLAGPEGVAVAARLRARYGVVLVDEFQDTDPLQWEIVRRAFVEGGTTVVLIGDPKQAIYAFRGADVHAYLDAARTAGEPLRLDVNRRSDQGLLDAYDALLGGTRLGHPEIAVAPVAAAPAHRTPRLSGAPACAPLRLRVVPRTAVERTRTGFAAAPSARAHIARDLAADVVALLRAGARIELRAPDGTPCGEEQVRPRHLAVLVRRNRDAALVRDALAGAGVPAVITGAGSVFGTPQARDWLRLLEALERPAQGSRARAAALTPFLGWTAQALACADDDAIEGVHRRLHEWAGVLRTRGVAALAQAVTLGERLPERVLRIEDGERRLTDLRHVAQLLHGAATAEGLGTTALAAWLRARIAEAEQDTDDEERSRRLESDAEAVQVLTIHRSKGLEFPIVLVPFLWDGRRPPRTPAPVVFHDAAAGDARTIDVALEGAAFRAHAARALEEDRGEDLRLAYVALTRARHQAVVWWAGSMDSRFAALTRLLFARDDDGGVALEAPRTPSDADALERLHALADAAPGCLAVEDEPHPVTAPWVDPLPAPATLVAATFDRPLDRGWRRTSYSDLTAAADEARVGSEPEERAVEDEPAEPVAAPAAPDEQPELRAAPSPLGATPAGTHVGTLVHRVLEAVDFAASDLDAELAAALDTALARRPFDAGDRDALLAGLRAAIETPLGPAAADLRLRDVGRADRLDELAFELPLAGGDRPAGWVAPTAIGALLREHLPAGDPLRPYADRLGDPGLRQGVRGFLTGSIDLVLRLPGPRFAIVDYKTNWLAAPGEDLTAWHYRPPALAAEMARGHYALQALLYLVALHRFLRWRLPGYDPDRHVAGALYLFLRGMGAPGRGVFAWRPPAALLVALSDLLDAG